jgi:tetratricopeptide (TPR) repeat protein
VLERGLEVCPDDTTSQRTLFGAVHNQGIMLLKEAEAAKEDSTRRRFYAEAASWFESAGQLEPEAMDNLYNLGVVYFQLVSLGDSTRADAARETFERFLARAEKKEERANTLYQLTLLEVRARTGTRRTSTPTGSSPSIATHRLPVETVATTERGGRAERGVHHLLNSLEKEMVENLTPLGQARPVRRSPTWPRF